MGGARRRCPERPGARPCPAAGASPSRLRSGSRPPPTPACGPREGKSRCPGRGCGASRRGVPGGFILRVGREESPAHFPERSPVAPAPSPVLSHPAVVFLPFNPTRSKRPVPQGWGLPRAHLGTMTLDTRKGGGERDRMGQRVSLFSLSPVPTIKMRTWAQVDTVCQADSSAAGGID